MCFILKAIIDNMNSKKRLNDLKKTVDGFYDDIERERQKLHLNHSISLDYNEEEEDDDFEEKDFEDDMDEFNYMNMLDDHD